MAEMTPAERAELVKNIANLISSYWREGDPEPMTTCIEHELLRQSQTALTSDGKRIEKLERQNKELVEALGEPVAWTTQLALDVNKRLAGSPFALAFEVSPINLWGEKGVPLYALLTRIEELGVKENADG